MNAKSIQVGIIGAGYISDFHAKSIKMRPDTDLVAVCDLNNSLAKQIANKFSSARVYADAKQMLSDNNLDVVHVLTQPDSHYNLAKLVLENNSHVLIEKPLCPDLEQTAQLLEVARTFDRKIAINHNFLFSRPITKLKAAIDAGRLGPIKSVRVIWKKPLGQASHGPWDLWMLRDPRNMVYETGSHSISELLSIIGNPVIESVDLHQDKVLPSGAIFNGQWSVTGNAGRARFKIECAYDQGYDQHSVEVEGLFGVGVADVENDVFELYQNSGFTYDLERLSSNSRRGLSIAKQAGATFGSYGLSKFSSKFHGAPYESSMISGIENCYSEILSQPKRVECGAVFALKVAAVASDICQHFPAPTKESERNIIAIPATVETPAAQSTVLIIGATGFIGKRLFIELQNRGFGVRALVRNPSKLLDVKIAENSEIMRGDFRDKAIVQKALTGIDIVYHLAVAHSNSLDGYLRANLDPTLQLIDECKLQGIKRFVYTGTIDSLYLGPDSGTITSSTPVDSKISRRNSYAHCKAVVEQEINKLFEQENFPSVIVRPAIVLGRGGPVMHVGVANWLSLGRCVFWGDGNNKLPLVLVDDVATGLANAGTVPGIEGRTFNLSAESSLTAKEYAKEVENILESKISCSTSNPIKYWIGDVAKWIVKVIARHPDRSRIPSLRDWRCREQHAMFDTTDAQTLLRWSPESDREKIIRHGIHEPARDLLEI